MPTFSLCAANSEPRPTGPHLTSCNNVQGTTCLGCSVQVMLAATAPFLSLAMLAPEQAAWWASLTVMLLRSSIAFISLDAGAGVCLAALAVKQGEAQGFALVGLLLDAVL